MGIDKALTDDFPSVVINGVRYHYGRELAYGQYLVENAEYAKDYWCFDTREDLLAFLVNLPESADREWITRRHPDWHEVTHEQRGVYMEERDAHFLKLMEEKQKAGTAEYFNVLCFDEAGYYNAYAGSEHLSTCDNVDVAVCEHEAKDGGKEALIELRTVPTFDSEQRTIRMWRKQALKLASALIRAAGDVDARSPDDR